MVDKDFDSEMLKFTVENLNSELEEKETKIEKL